MKIIANPVLQDNPHYRAAVEIAQRFGTAQNRKHRLILAKRLNQKLHQFLEYEDQKGGAQ